MLTFFLPDAKAPVADVTETAKMARMIFCVESFLLFDHLDFFLLILWYDLFRVLGNETAELPQREATREV